MTKIFFLARSLNIGGAERQLVTLALGLLRRGYDVKVIVFSGGGKLESDLLSHGIPIFDLSRKSYKDLPAVFLKLRRILLAEKPDILFSLLPAANIWAGIMKIFFRGITVIWGVYASDDMLKGGWARLNCFMERVLSQKVDWVVANSYAGGLFVQQRGYPQDKIVVIPNGIDTDYFYPAPNVSFREKYGISPSQKLIGMVGRLDPVKDHQTFIEAVSLLIQQRNDLCFVCVGDGEKNYVDMLKRKADEMGLKHALIWTGVLDDISVAYNSLDVFVFTSHSEGAPNVIGEAMSCGVPCVASNVGDVSAIVGSTGELVPPGNPLALKDGVLTMLLNLENDPTLRHRTRQHILDNFSVKVYLDKTAQLLDRSR